MAPPLQNAAAVTAMTVKITEIENAEDALVLRVEGRLANDDLETFERTIDEIGESEKVVIELSGVTYIDSDAALVVRQLERKGVELKGVDFFIEAIIATSEVQD